MVTEDQKKLIEQYVTLAIWFMVHQDDKDITTEQFEAVLKEIGKIEDELKSNGVSQSVIKQLIFLAEQLYETPIDKLSKSTQLRMCKIIFGAGTKWSDTPPTPKQSLEKGESDAETM